MTADKQSTPKPNPAPGTDPSARIRFDEPPKLPVKLIAMVGGGVLAVSAAAFFGLYKLNVKPVDNSPRPEVLGTPDKGRMPYGGGAAPGPTPMPMTPVAPSATASLPGTKVDESGAVVVTEPDQCTYLKLHLQNLAEMAGGDKEGALQEWIQVRRAATLERMSFMRC